MLYRTGPGGHQVATENDKTFSISHWFDGFVHAHRFQLLLPEKGDHIKRILYNSRCTCNEHIEKVRKTGDLSGMTFGQQQDPCQSLFRKAMSTFRIIKDRGDRGVSGVNVGVTIQRNFPGLKSSNGSKTDDAKSGRPSSIQTMWQKTDSTTMQEIDPTTLEPIGIANQQKLHPELRGPLSAAHARTDPKNGDVYNYNLDIGRQATYRVFCVSASTGKTSILATISGGDVKAVYMHSIMLTEHFVILCLFDAYYAMGGVKMLWTRNLLDAMEFDPNKKNKWLVIDRVNGKGLVGVFESDPFFAFHCINAWEQPSENQPGKVDIIADIATYANLDILKRFYYHNLKSTSRSALDYVSEPRTRGRAQLTRWKLPGVGTNTVFVTAESIQAECLSKAKMDDSPELPTFNPKLATRPSRYIYGARDGGRSTFIDGIIKFDTQTQTAKHWVQHAQTPGEPIFLPNPEGKDEDDGVLLSVVLDGNKGKSYLLVVDAKEFVEVGRAEMEVVVGFGFHGVHIADKPADGLVKDEVAPL